MSEMLQLYANSRPRRQREFIPRMRDTCAHTYLHICIYTNKIYLNSSTFRGFREFQKDNKATSIRVVQALMMFKIYDIHICTYVHISKNKRELQRINIKRCPVMGFPRNKSKTKS